MNIYTNRREKLVFFCSITIFSLLISLLSIQRSYFGFGTETDFLGGFLPEAQKFIDGQALLLEFHPPLYSISLALVQTVVQDWLKTGLFVSFVASIVTVITVFLFFYYLLSRYAGWGSVGGLVASSVFLEYSVYATSDIFFLALYSSSLLLSLLAIKKKTAYLWILCGITVGCLLLTRTNGITCLFIAALPLWSTASLRQKRDDFLLFTAGLSIPLLTWFIYAFYSGSQLTPTGTYANFALTYFSPADRISGDARLQVEEKFDSLIEVLSYDPIHIAKTYLKDLASLGKKIPGMLQPLLVLFIPIGIFSFFKSKPKNLRISTFYIILTLLQVFLINFKAYEARYFLFFVPILGAFVGESFRYLVSLAPRPKSRRMVVGLCTLCAVFALTLSYYSSWEAVNSSVGELEEVVPKARMLGLEGASIVARKPNISFYTASVSLPFPNVETMPDLKCALEGQSGSGDIFLFYGTQERAYRPQLKALSNPKSSPRWLNPIEHSTKPNRWVLYQYNLAADAISSQSCQSRILTLPPK